MARTKAQFIFATFVASGIALILSVVALGTDQWVTGSINLSTSTGRTPSTVNYGLFTGSYTRFVVTSIAYGLTPTCDFGKNKCAMLCGESSLRGQYLENLLDDNTSTDGYAECSASRSNMLNNLFSKVDVKSVKSQLRADDDIPAGFINCGVWLSTIIFLVLSCLCGVVTTIMALWNTVANPVETFFNIFGLYIYNGIACTCSLIATITWGVHFAVNLSENVGIYDTIAGIGDNSGQVALGYSFWLNVVAIVLYESSIVILIVRQYLINREPETIVNIEDKNDAIILF